MKLTYILLFLMTLNINVKAQYKSIDFEISTSPYFDNRTDNEFDFDLKSIVGITQYGLGYSSSVNNKFVISPKAAFGLGTEWYKDSQFSNSPTVSTPSVVVEKMKIAKFLKLGITVSYWFNRLGKGPFAEAELQNIFTLSAKSKDRKLLFSGEVQDFIVDYKDELKSSVPSFRIGIGYNLPIKKISLFVRIGLEFRASTYFTTTDNYIWANRSFGFGVRYTIEKQENISKDTTVAF